MLLSHLASRLYGTPLLIARPKFDVILSMLGSRIGLHNPSLPNLDMDMAMPAPRQPAPSAQAGIAVIPVVGELHHQNSAPSLHRLGVSISGFRDTTPGSAATCACVTAIG